MTENFVLVHGAWHGGWAWQPVASRLRAASGSRSAQRHRCGTARGWGQSGIRSARVSQSGVIPAASKSA